MASAICFLLAVLLALRAWFIRWTNEIVVTDRRVIYAHGFIQRHTVEVHMDKIESVDVDQTVMGRMLDLPSVMRSRRDDPDPHLRAAPSTGEAIIK